jgi:mono/diheme cytochrome c family protein
MRRSLLLLILGALLSLGACNDRPRYPERRPPSGFLQAPANIGAGRRLFETHCAECHGTLEEGRLSKATSFVSPPADFTSPRFLHIDPSYLFWRISTGKTVEPYLSRGSVMPAWGPYFSTKQIWQLVAYLRQRPRARH